MILHKIFQCAEVRSREERTNLVKQILQRDFQGVMKAEPNAEGYNFAMLTPLLNPLLFIDLPESPYLQQCNRTTRMQHTMQLITWILAEVSSKQRCNNAIADWFQSGTP